MPTTAADFNAQVIREFRARGGRVGGVFEGTPLLLLHHTDRVIPVIALTKTTKPAALGCP